jgi:addiction module HigA family antidote
MITMHPGEYLAMAYVDPMCITQSRLATHLQVDRSSVSRLLSCEADLTPNMAVRLSLVFDLSAEAWMEMQTQHSIKLEKLRLEGKQFEPLTFQESEQEHAAA